MVHIAIMKRSWRLTQKILSGEKSIETRWYKSRAIPWNRVKEGETIYFKDSGSPVTVKAVVSKVEQFEDLNDNKISKLLDKYKEKDLGTKEISSEVAQYIKGKRYAIVIHLRNSHAVKPFNIDKSGYGLQSAWMCVEDLKDVKI